MIHAYDVLKILDAFEALKANKVFSEETKKLIAAELLTSVPHEIMAPGCKVTSDAVRSIIKDYIGVPNVRNNPGKAEEASSGTEKGSSSEETMSPKRSEVEREAPSANRTVERPRVESVEARKNEERQGTPPRKGSGGPRRNS